MKRFALIAAASLLSTGPAHADTVQDAWCQLSRHDHTINHESFSCDFTQTHAAVYVDSKRWAFVFPHAQRGKTYQRQNTEDFVRFIREGQYTLTLFQGGKPARQPGGW